MRFFVSTIAAAALWATPALSASGSVLDIDRTPQGFDIEAPEAADPFDRDKTDLTDDPINDALGDAPAERISDFSRLPDAVADMRAKLIAAARTGDIAKLAPLADPGEGGTQLTISTGEFWEGEDDTSADAPGDALAYIARAADDPSSVEALAILIDILEPDPVLFAAGTEEETYVWPWFWARSPGNLSPEETVELLRVVTWFDLEEMRAEDSYTFYRLGIAPDGRWRFFISGD